jgi:amino acid transporter
MRRTPVARLYSLAVNEADEGTNARQPAASPTAPGATSASSGGPEGAAGRRPAVDAPEDTPKDAPVGVHFAPVAPLAVLTPPPAEPADAGAAYPEAFRYRVKNKLLGRPLVSEQLKHERLRRPIALGVLAPDCISSSAYGTEEMLTQLTPYVGLAAFTLVVPITLAILGVLFFVTLSYLEVIQLYTKAGGSYVVARDNFGPKVAQVAAVALLIDYTVTVAVQTSAGTAALTSAVPSLIPWTVPITVAVVLVLLYGNLRGIREAGKYFALPTYFFVLSLGGIIIAGYVERALGTLPTQAIPAHSVLYGHAFGTPGHGLLMGLAFIALLRSFANGGSSLTGLEAISNGVSAFRPPESRNARVTLVAMSSVLAFLVFGVTMLARWTHAVPYAAGSPTVVSQVVRDVAGHGPIFYVVQIATLLILYTGGNTSFNGFPFLASFVAGDSFLPRQLTRRGHRLAFSSGIIVLTVVALALILAFRANVDSLVALYAIGVFTGFCLAGSGMVKHHLTARGRHWRRSVIVNGFAAVLTAAVVLIFAVAKFTEGAWVVVVVGPLMYWGLIRMHRQYVKEEEQLESGASRAAASPVLRRHVVVVLVDRLDMASARAIQYARTLSPDELRAVHFDIDNAATRQLVDDWSRLGLSRLPLDIVDVPDRRLGRAALELVADVVVDGDTECTLLLPRRGFTSGWQRLLHDRTADKIATVVSQVPHVSATIVPFNLASSGDHGAAAVSQRMAAHAMSRSRRQRRDPGSGHAHAARKAEASMTRSRPPAAGTDETEADRALARRSQGTRPIGEVEWRQRVRIAGRVKSMRVQPRAGTQNLECTLADRTGRILLVFQGRPRIPGIELGARLVAEGMVGAWGRRLAILNPDYELVAERDTDDGPPAEGR